MPVIKLPTIYVYPCQSGKPKESCTVLPFSPPPYSLIPADLVSPFLMRYSAAYSRYIFLLGSTNKKVGLSHALFPGLVPLPISPDLISCTCSTGVALVSQFGERRRTCGLPIQLLQLLQLRLATATATASYGYGWLQLRGRLKLQLLQLLQLRLSYYSSYSYCECYCCYCCYCCYGSSNYYGYDGN